MKSRSQHARWRSPVTQIVFGFVIALVTAIIHLLPEGRPVPISPMKSPSGSSDAQHKVRIADSYGKLPLSFEPNVGQADEAVKFISRGMGYTLFLKTDEAVLALSMPDTQCGGHDRNPSGIVRIGLLSSNPTPNIHGRDPLPGKVNYFIGNEPKDWHRDLPTFSQVEYKEVYPGIDLVYYGNQRRLEYDFKVAPGANPGLIHMDIRGADVVRSDENGDLVLGVAGTPELRLCKPDIYQEGEGGRRYVDGRYVVSKDTEVRFEVGEYDPTNTLVIDPQVQYVAHFGNTVDATSIAVDEWGNAYVVGIVGDTHLPVVNAVQPTYASPEYDSERKDGFVSKINAEGTQFIYSTYLGGRGNDECSDVAVDELGQACVVGLTEVTFSGEEPFPIKNAFQANHGGGVEDAFITKLSASGNDLVFSTFFGGEGSDVGEGIAVDRKGDIYLTGNTSAPSPYTQNPGFPLKNQWQTSLVDGAFLAKLSADGSALYASFIFGGTKGLVTSSGTYSAANHAHDIAVDTLGNPVIVGTTHSTDFPVSNAFQAVCPDTGYPVSGFVIKFNTNCSALLFSSYLGGMSWDTPEGVAVDPSGNTYITGHTYSTDFPTTSGAYSRLLKTTTVPGFPTADAFVVKVSPIGQLSYSTYLGGHHWDWGFGIAADANGNAWIVGETMASDFPLQDPLTQKSCGDSCAEGFVAQLDPEGSSLLFSSFLAGGSWGTGGEQAPPSIAVDNQGNAYVSCGGGFAPPVFVSNFPYSGSATVIKFGTAAPRQRIQVWQALTVRPATGQLTGALSSYMVTIDGVRAHIWKLSPDSMIIRVPEGLIGPRLGVTRWPDTTPREVELVARWVRGVADTVEINRKRFLFYYPRPLLYDELVGPSPALVQGTLRGAGPRFCEAFMFIGRPADQHAAVRLLNTTRATQVPAKLLGKVISPDSIYYDSGLSLTTGNLPLVGLNNASQQFPVSVEGLYLIICEAESPESAPISFMSPGPFPCYYQVHLSGNAGLPQKYDESGRATRLDTYFNAPAPRWQVLGNQDPTFGQIAQQSLCKFSKEFTSSPYPFAVLLPPTTEGFPSGTPPVRARPQLLAGEILPNQFDPTTPTARTLGLDLADSCVVVDWSQVPLPASLVVLGAGLPGVSQVFGASDGNGFTLPQGTIGSIIFDMGSGNEIVDGSGPDFSVSSTAGSYTVAAGNTPFAPSFVPLQGGAVSTGGKSLDLSGSGLTVARYIRVTANSTVVIDGLMALNQFISLMDPIAGPLVFSQTATMTTRRLKSPVGLLDPYLELIGPDGSFLGENESGFGDVTSVDRSDAALIKKQLPSFGFYRFTTRGYPLVPDEQAFGTYFARIETGGEWDLDKVPISQLSEAETSPQKSGSISEVRQRNSYLFEAQPGTRVKIIVEGGSGTPLADPVLELYDPEEFLIAASDNFEGRGKNPALSVTLPSVALPSGPGLRSGQAFPNPSTYRVVISAVDALGSENALPSGGRGYIRTSASGNYGLKVFTGAMTGGEPSTLQVSSLWPDAAVQGAAGVALRLLGTDFQAGASVSFSGTGITVKAVTFVGQGELDLVIDVALSASLGKRDVTVSIPGGQTVTAPGLFDVRQSVGNVVLNWNAPAVGQTMNPPGNLSAQFSPSGGAMQSYKSVVRRYVPGAKLSRSVGATTKNFRPVSGMTPESNIAEVEPNNTVSQAQVLTGDTLIVVNGRAEVRDAGEVEDFDDIEDLYKVTTTQPGMVVMLGGFNSDCDLFLIDPVDTTVLDASIETSAVGPEVIEWLDLPAGTYLVGVSIFDPYPIGPDSTAYTLEIRGHFGGTATLTLQSYNIYRSTQANAKGTGMKAGSVGIGTTTYADAVPHTGNFYYQVTAVYNQGESSPSNEVSKMVTEVGSGALTASLPGSCALRQNYPNPFNPKTVIQYQLPLDSRVHLAVYDLLGKVVALLVNERKRAGTYEVTFDAKGLASGVYLYRIQTEAFQETKKLLVLQ